MTSRTESRILRRIAVCVAVLGFAAALVAQTPESKPGVPSDGSSSMGWKPTVPTDKASSPDWKVFSYPVDGFQATFPSAPDLQKKQVPTDAGSFQLHTYIAQDSPAALFVAVVDYGSTASGKDADTLLQASKNGVVQNSGLHLLSEKKITLGDNPGLEFEGQSDSAFFTFRIYLAGSALYQTLVIVPLGKSYAGAARFLDSFQLIPRTTN